VWAAKGQLGAGGTQGSPRAARRCRDDPSPAEKFIDGQGKYIAFIG